MLNLSNRCLKTTRNMEDNNMLDANPGANDDFNHNIEDLESASIDTDDIDGNELDDADDSGARYEHFRFVADKGQALLRVDKFLVERMQKSSRNRIQQAAQAGCILVNGNPVKSNYRVKPLDVVSIVMDRPRYECEIIAEDIPIDIVYEDDDLLVVNKQRIRVWWFC